VSIWRISGATLEFGPPQAAGIVNVTDDSFFSGARSGTPERAIADGLALVEAGFEILDVGAVAARSGPPVDVDHEAGRLVPAIQGLVREAGVPVLADTFSPEVATRAAGAGAAAINDIGGGRPDMLERIADTDCGYVLMHIEGPPRVDRPAPHYDDVVEHLKRWFAEGIERAGAAGIDETRIALDPGLDFDLTTDDGIEIMRRLGELRELGRPLFVALSRKDFLGAIAAGSWEARLEPDERGPATLAATALAVEQGAEMLRLHDVEALDAMRVAAAIIAPAR
jgi:dihydropteroate synthase